MGEKDSSRLRRSVAPGSLKVELVSAYAGDRELDPDERADLEEQVRAKGTAFFSDLLYAVTHHYFAPEIAEKLWAEILRHKHEISALLGRNVRVTVAALDYLSNVTDEMISPTLISEAYAVEIANLSMRDGMTDLYNHTSFHELLDVEFRHQRRYGSSVGLVLLDVDDFKRVNDVHGHQAGDRVLIALADTLRLYSREADICARIGGEEFAVILPFTSRSEEAVEIAERIRKHANTIRCGETPISVSAGVAVSGQNAHSPRALIEMADRALYRAKREGKNRVVLVGVDDV